MTTPIDHTAVYAPRNSGSGKKRRTKRRRRHTSPDHPLTYSKLLKQFVACGHCSTLLTGYRLIHGVEALEKAVAQQQGGWITLQWDKPTRQLVAKAYDVHVEQDTVYFDLSCTECQRRLSYREVQEGQPADTFQVNLKL